ncbi:efflux RND transporter periplasmic adaptor subunit [Ferrimonas kyonanensis]|uniref:efflux RND transporter periplasmic adaptor subunit n=1 Tax=Ferrimonas kyonanensis TaxID=364763 RepID=UPI00041DCA21|nr:efflux RND transporter periplasmic adaptor subunit [Ferrimonas kyonanensis]
MKPLSTPMLLSSLALSLILAGCSHEAPHYADKTPRPIRAITLTAAQQQETLTLPAMLVPIDTAELAFRVPGPVAAIGAKEGDMVAKGQPLMRLDPHDFDVQITEYQARLREAKAQAKQARQERKRVLTANAEDAIARVELDRANTAVERSEASVTVVEQRLQMMRDAKRYSVLNAPFDGIVASISIEPHEQAIPTSPVLTLHGLSGYEVQMDVPEQIAQRLMPGQKVRFNATGQQQSLSASIHEIRRSANLLSRSFRVTARLDDQPKHGWPEQTGLLRISLPIDNHSGHLVPSSAVQSDGTHHYVAVLDHQTLRRVAVTVSGLESDQIRVNGALNQGDQLVISGAAYFDDGAPVGTVLLDDQQAQL